MHTENYSELLDSVAGALEKDLKVKKGFFKAIVVGDDWSFVIKLNALFEASLTEGITKSLDKEQLRDVIARLDLGQKDTGKLVVAYKLGLLTGKQRQFIQMLASLRNELVHHVRNIEFSFATPEIETKKHVENLYGSAQKLYVEIAYAQNEIAKDGLASRLGKIGIWIAAILVLGQLLTNKRSTNEEKHLNFPVYRSGLQEYVNMRKR